MCRVRIRRKGRLGTPSLSTGYLPSRPDCRLVNSPLRTPNRPSKFADSSKEAVRSYDNGQDDACSCPLSSSLTASLLVVSTLLDDVTDYRLNRSFRRQLP